MIHQQLFFFAPLASKLVVCAYDDRGAEQQPIHDDDDALAEKIVRSLDTLWVDVACAFFCCLHSTTQMAFSASIKLVVEGMTDLNVGDNVFLQRKTIFKIEMFVVDIQIENFFFWTLTVRWRSAPKNVALQ